MTWVRDTEHGYGLHAIKRDDQHAGASGCDHDCLHGLPPRLHTALYPSCLQPRRPQDDATGQSALMAAAAAGATEAVEALLQAGAPWNAVDRRGRCAGDYAMEGDHGDAAGAILEAG